MVNNSAMTNYREQAIRDVAAWEHCDAADMEAHVVQVPDGLFAYTVSQRERVRELEAAIRGAILHLDEVGWPVVKQALEAQLRGKESK